MQLPLISPLSLFESSTVKRGSCVHANYNHNLDYSSKVY